MSEPIGAAHSYRWKAEQEMLKLRRQIAAMGPVVEAADAAIARNMGVPDYCRLLNVLHAAVEKYRAEMSDSQTSGIIRT